LNTDNISLLLYISWRATKEKIYSSIPISHHTQWYTQHTSQNDTQQTRCRKEAKGKSREYKSGEKKTKTTRAKEKERKQEVSSIHLAYILFQ